MNIGMEVTLSGSLADGRLEKAVDTAVVEAQRRIAVDGVVEVREQLARVLKHPTGYYQRHIAVKRTGRGDVVHDSGVVYGPWLDGSGGRNKSTRFKGYAHWRRATQALQRKAATVTSQAIDVQIRKLG